MVVSNIAKILAFAIAFASASYLVTKGEDGSLRDFWILFSCIFVAHTLISAFLRSSWLYIPLELVIYELAAIAVLSRTHLDEMAGMLYMFIPAAIALTVFVELVVLSVAWVLSRS